MPHAGSAASPDCSGGSLTHCPGQGLSRTVRMTSLHSRQISGRSSSRASCSSRLWHSPQRQCPHGVAMDQTVVPGSSGRKVPKQQLQSLVYSACCRIDLARSSSTRYLAKRILTAVGENLSRVARASLRDNRAQHARVRRRACSSAVDGRCSILYPASQQTCSLVLCPRLDDGAELA